MEKEIIYYPNGKVEKEGYLLDGKKEGMWVRYFENGVKEIEMTYKQGELSGSCCEWYENGQLAEEGEYRNGAYKVINYWNEQGEQLLINGTGKTIRKFGATQGDIYEQYFKEGKFKGEKKIAGVVYGKFIPDRKN